jgi:ABC-type polysaccharide/polyol phosphate export permease
MLGPLWAVIQPLSTTVVFAVVFGGIAGLTPPFDPPTWGTATNPSRAMWFVASPHVNNMG